MRLTTAAALTALSTAVSAQPFFEDFEFLRSEDWYVAEYDFGHPHFDTDWRAANVSLADGLKLTLTPHDGLNRFAGASVRRHNVTHFGRYEAVMTAAKGAGVVTGFFLYTGPAYGTQHDEIDWEFFGQDTTTAQVAWFKNGVLRNHKIQLGFDAATTPARYGIEWWPDRLRWFVNDQLVFETTEAIPQTPQRVFANVWAVDPTLEIWAGLAAPDTKTQAKAHSILFTPLENTQDFNG